MEEYSPGGGCARRRSKMRSLSAPILVKHPTHSPYPVPGAPPMYAFHNVSAPLLYGFNPCTTPCIPFSSLPAPRKSFLNLNLEYLPICFCSSSLKPTALPHINQIGATGLIHLSMGALIPSEGQPAPSLGNPRSSTPGERGIPKTSR